MDALIEEKPPPTPHETAAPRQHVDGSNSCSPSVARSVPAESAGGNADAGSGVDGRQMNSASNMIGSVPKGDRPCAEDLENITAIRPRNRAPPLRPTCVLAEIGRPAAASGPTVTGNPASVYGLHTAAGSPFTLNAEIDAGPSRRTPRSGPYPTIISVTIAAVADWVARRTPA